MLRSILILLFAIVTLQLNAASKDKAVAKDTVVTKAYLEKLEARIQKLETTTTPGQLTKDRLDLINDKIDNLKSETDRSTDDIANLISASSTGVTVLLGVWSLIFAIAGLGLGAYINSQQKKTAENLIATKANLDETKVTLDESKTILEKSKSILKSQEEIEAQVIETRHLIDNNLSELYHKLQLEEVDYLISRLEKDPRDIENIFSKLATIHLPEEYFSKFNDLIISNPDMNRASKRTIELVIQQHFPNLWLKYSLYKEDFVESYYWFISAMFVKEQEDQLTALINHYKTEVPSDLDFAVGASYIIYDSNYWFDQNRKAIEETNFQLPLFASHKVKVQKRIEYFYNRLPSKELKFALAKKALQLTTLNSLSKANLKLIYGDLLIRDYKDDSNNTEGDTKILVDLESVPQQPVIQDSPPSS